LGRNPTDFNRSFVINEKKNRRYSLWWWYVGSEYCTEWARYWAGERGEEGRISRDTPRLWIPPLSVIPPHVARATVRVLQPWRGLFITL